MNRRSRSSVAMFAPGRLDVRFFVDSGGLAQLLSCSDVVSRAVLMPRPVHALNPEIRLTQYLHTSWRIQDGSLPAGMFSITQTSDGFLWLLSLPGDLYRFDGVRFVRWPVPPGPSGKVFADSAGGLWVTARELVHLKKGVVASQFELDRHSRVSEHQRRS